MTDREQASLVSLTATDTVNRRTALTTGATALTGLGLTTSTATAQDTDELDVHTGDIEVVSKNKAKAKGQVTGMKEAGCQKLRIGCEHKYKDEDKWHSGFYGTVTATYSITFILTIIGLKPRKKCDCRIICCPVDNPGKIRKGNIVTFETAGYRTDKPHKREKKQTKHEKCPCSRDHQGKKHVTFNCDRGGWSSYFIQVTGQLTPCGDSCVPSKISHDEVKDDWDDDSATAAENTLWDRAHSYLFTGDITEIETGADVAVYINGEQYR